MKNPAKMDDLGYHNDTAPDTGGVNASETREDGKKWLRVEPKPLLGAPQELVCQVRHAACT